MTEIRCPNCGHVIPMNETDYANIVSQVRNAEFDKSFATEVARVEASIRAQADTEIKAARSECDMRLKNMQASHTAAVQQAISETKAADLTQIQELNQRLSAASTDVVRLRGELALAEQKQNNAVMQAVHAEKERGEVERRQLESELVYYKDLKTRMSTKMVGESLEQYCYDQFNRYRGAFPYTYFEKDNKVSSASGSKGDFIFRAYTKDNVELVSIMFEMKNEMDTTATKHKNEDFFKELDKDRVEKKCEYAVLVSMLEADSDYYNDGIVDMSHRYAKMYVIRPQFFIPFISLIYRAAWAASESRVQLMQYRNQNIDLMQFEHDVEDYKVSVQQSCGHMTAKYQEALADIDKCISVLQKAREDLRLMQTHMDRLQAKSERLSIPKLMKNAPGVQSMLADAITGGQTQV